MDSSRRRTFVPDVHLHGDLCLPAVAPEAAFTGEQPDQEALLQFCQWFRSPTAELFIVERSATAWPVVEAIGDGW
jgi:hypothetical protein